MGRVLGHRAVLVAPMNASASVARDFISSRIVHSGILTTETLTRKKVVTPHKKIEV